VTRLEGVPVRVTEVGPRDGLQNEGRAVATAAKARFVRALLEAGHRDVEVTSFVRPDRVPQLADAEELFALLGPPPEGVVYGALVPNERGLERALATGAGKVAVFTAASETFNQRNVNATIDASFERFGPVAKGTKAAGLLLRGYVSVAVACPYEGPIDPQVVRGVVLRLFDLGCDEVSVGDTIGAGTPGDVGRLLDVLLGAVRADDLVLHFHDTRGMAIANVLEALSHGIRAFDASSGGLGGCPFAPGASGNLATEDLVFLLDGLGAAHGLDLERQRLASREIEPHVAHRLASRVYQAPPLRAFPCAPEA
jgi:hydroxymethylglutaryl-CoA lyase